MARKTWNDLEEIARRAGEVADDLLDVREGEPPNSTWRAELTFLADAAEQLGRRIRELRRPY
jgi:hypothetical protein